MQNIVKLLLKKKLAACVSLKDIYSIYKWNGNIEESKEVEIIIKSKPDLLIEIKSFLQKHSSNKVPQIIYKSFNSERKYLNWVYKSTLN